MRRRKQAALSAVLPQSDGVDEFREDRCQRMPSIDVRAEFVVVSTEILDERVSGTDLPCRA